MPSTGCRPAASILCALAWNTCLGGAGLTSLRRLLQEVFGGG
jgi:hypothetical protein